MTRRGDARGFTLVEMLVVLAIVAIMAGVTVIAMGSGGGARGARAEADRLAARLRLAADDVRVAERPLALAWDARGYAFVDWDARANRWLADRVTLLGERHDLPRGMTLAVDGASPILIAPDGAGPAIVARLHGPGASWSVTFDGLDARVAG